MSSVFRQPMIFLKLIRFEHTLFALPFALAGALLAAGGLPMASTLAWILVAMVGARTAAMAFNRLVDRRFDAANPRTASRPSVTGTVTPAFMALSVVLAAALFVYAASRLNALALALAGPTLGVLLGYSLVKRFWHHSHLVLGLALGLSPLGAWVAVRGRLDDAWPAAALGLAVLLWTNGFDILYACQDEDFDRATGLHSVPQRFGRRRALTIARLSHAMVVPALAAAGWTAGSGLAFFLGVAVVAALLVHEHRLVSADDLSRVNLAFFQVNVAIGFVVLLATGLDLWMAGGPGA
ncbi:MAG: putative 4-hydroxybenzoate polyprenyltransferase [Planctomycetes bacterium]|nr:putative 4-hydroxybenzoate polyprenyltransferase [Planctomycetota bacterium]